MTLAGRGWGKTRTGAEWVRSLCENTPGLRVALVSRTAADARDVMIEGESGLLSVCPPWNKPEYFKSTRRVVWPNGSMAIAYSAEKPEMLRGPQHHHAWCDELAAWTYDEAWDQLQFGLRLGSNPKILVTTTPTPTELIRNLAKDKTTALVSGSTFDNKTNLAPHFLKKILAKYEGTRLGEQELFGRILDDIQGALWKYDVLKRIDADKVPPLKRVVTAVDPAVTNNKNSDETGIITAGIDRENKIYVWGDFSIKASADTWARRSIAAYDEYRCDLLVGEVNNGGDLVEAVIRTHDRKNRINYKAVRASRGKFTRAEPIAALYEQGRVYHVGIFKDLEEQMCSYVPGVTKKSPDRMDALVWAITSLIEGSGNYSGAIRLGGDFSKSSWKIR